MKNPKFKQYIKYIVINILSAAILSLLLINYVASAYKIKGNSMNSVLMDRERIIISKISLCFGKINRFDIVVLYKPNEPKKSIIKRVIGLPGETIEIREGDVYIDNKKLFQPFLKPREDFISRSDNMPPMVIRDGYYFVMGDNRAVSHDSRSFGPVPGDSIFGKTFFRYWPLSRMGKVK